MNIVKRLTLGKVLKWLLFFIVGTALIWYAAFQARLFISGPSLVLRNDTVTLHDMQMTRLNGTAKNIVAITLNDRPIFTDDDGNFSEPLVLENGYTIMTLRAKDRYGREKMLARSFVYVPAYKPRSQETP